MSDDVGIGEDLGRGFLYGSLRLTHLLLTAAAIPAGLYYLHDEVTQSAVVAIVVGVFAVMWAFFFIVMLQASYPPRLVGALRTTIALLTNVAASASVGGVLRGAYSAMYASVVAGAVMGVFFAVRLRRPDPAIPEEQRIIGLRFGVGLAALAMIATVVLGGPFFTRVGDGGILDGMMVAVGFALHAASLFAVVYRNSHFSRHLQSQRYADAMSVFQRWTGLTALVIFVTMGAILVAVIA